MLNFFLCVDLIKIIRNPFGSKENRVTKYLIYSIVIGLLNAGTFLKTNSGGSIFQLLIMVIYLLAAIWSLIFCTYRLFYSGLSKES